MEEDEDDLPLSEWVRRIDSVNFACKTIVDWYLSWIAQLVRALAQKAKGPDSSSGPGYNFSLSVLQLAKRRPVCEN